MSVPNTSSGQEPWAVTLPLELRNLEYLILRWEQCLEDITPTPEVQTLCAELVAVARTWISTPCRKRLIQSWLHPRKPEQGWNIDTAILMAIGNLEGEPGVDEKSSKRHRKERLLHLAIFLDVSQYLRNEAGYYIPLYAQEPKLNTTDIELLKLLNIQVLMVPQAENWISKNYFVMAPFHGEECLYINRPPDLTPSLTIGLPLEHVLKRALVLNQETLVHMFHTAPMIDYNYISPVHPVQHALGTAINMMQGMISNMLRSHQYERAPISYPDEVDMNLGELEIRRVRQKSEFEEEF